MVGLKNQVVQYDEDIPVGAVRSPQMRNKVADSLTFFFFFFL